MNCIKVAIVEDNKALRLSLETLINVCPEMKLAGSFANANSILNDLSAVNADIVLMDIQMPGMNGIEALKVLKKELPEIKVIIQTVFENDDYILSAICNGASGYLLKKSTDQEYLNAIIDTFQGGSPLTPSIATKVLALFNTSKHQNKIEFSLSERETEILKLLVEGLSYKMIAGRCNITYDTVRFHIKNIYSKLQVESMTEAVAFAIKNGLV